HRSPAPGDRVDRRRMLERRGRGAARHFAENRESALGRPPAEARLRTSSADPQRVPSHHWARPPPTKPRSRTTGSEGLTATAPAAFEPQARSLSRTPWPVSKTGIG